MKGAITVGEKLIEIVDLPAPKCKENEALVDVHTVTLCGTDIHIWEGHYACEFPIVQGHEISGTIKEVAPGQVDADGRTLEVGDSVVIHPLIPCGVCPPCLNGRENACTDLSVLGCYTNGGLTETIAVPTERIVAIPKTLDLRTAALTEPVSIAYHAVRRSKACAGEKAVVFGCGAIGLIAIRALKDKGCEVLAIDTVADRIRSAQVCGADRVVLAGVESVEEVVAAWAGQFGPEIVIEATGVPQCFESAINVVGCTGRVVAVGISEHSAQIPLRSLPTKEIEILGSRNCEGGLTEPLKFLTLHQKLFSSLITHQTGLSGVSLALEQMARRASGVGKIAVLMDMATSELETIS
ncbi:alcohol dehydrogenase catalytic domain-containing protein [Corynebacterium poyangense]|uniref:Alcohol dehydrogenase catalytic domain-containing protein n=1 Tax=Corynebacterium poyangense TaxID=2684405 RepID=A0A7H0SQI7_9CORY|nr:alcohol dehydrogenase catalytic domain-containing protein [Corynebacterium poyangense]QNQ90812.1 alcohol dehydrogenase catalytic domain-containing protein [Corynebacterium poyangense]